MATHWRFLRWRLVALLTFLCVTPSAVFPADHSLELSRPVRPWEFLSAVGTQAGLFGNESGDAEAWVYPLKILRNFHLQFHVRGKVLPARELARTLTVHPESSSIDYAGDTFRVRETFFVPVHEPGAVIELQVDTAEPLEIEAVFESDFQLEWPAALGGTYVAWDTALKAFWFGEEQKKYSAYVGSPTATEHREAYSDNYSSSHQNSLRLGVTAKGKETRLLVLAGSVNGKAEAEAAYRRLTASYATLEAEARDYYRSYLDRTVNLELPDSQLQAAYDWSRISMLQGLVSNPTLGTGLIAGYRTSGRSQRPGFAWFFGRDALWTALALNAEGDFATTRTALEFLAKYQRPDGKVEHEISQAAGLVPWFQDYIYAYASADATPLFIIASADYVTRSGDTEFAKAEWDKLWLAYQFLRSTYGRDGLPQNAGVGHGWVEGGPLLPVATEFYQSGLGAEALRALASLAEAVGKHDIAQQLTADFTRQRERIDQAFWSPDKNIYSFALDANGQQMQFPSVLTTVPMWFGLLDEQKAEQMVDVLTGHDHQADWGMRIISSSDSRYNPSGYHYGTVWPLFTGWASVGEYRYHRSSPGYMNLRSNALLALDGGPGHVTEVLSGDYYQPISSSSPHQIWSAAMVVSPLLRGMLGLDVDAAHHRLRFAPHIPADWKWLQADNIRVGEALLDLKVQKTVNGIELDVRRRGSEDCVIEFAPALSLRTQVVTAALNGKKVAVHNEENSQDYHARLEFSIHDRATVRLGLRKDFGISLPSSLPPLGARSQGLRVTSEKWSANREELELSVSGISGKQYDLAVWNAGEIASIEGAELVKGENGSSALRMRLPTGGSEYVHSQVALHFADGAKKGH
jgi:glycogen debranching enzyme